MLTQDRLKELLTYDPETGLFTWNRSRGRVAAGNVAGCKDHDGYIQIRVDKNFFKAHRLAFLYMTGSFPTNKGDHENRVRDDNRWLNLRDATVSQNNANRAVSSLNRLGIKGVRLTESGKYTACVTIDYKRENLGVHDTIDDAASAYAKAANRVHGEFARAA